VARHDLDAVEARVHVAFGRRAEGVYDVGDELCRHGARNDVEAFRCHLGRAKRYRRGSVRRRMGLPSAVPQLSEYPAVVPVYRGGNLGERGDAVVSEELDVIGVRRGMNGRRFGNDEGTSARGSRLMVGDEIRARKPVAQHARHVAGGEDSIAQSDIAELNRLEEVWKN